MNDPTSHGTDRARQSVRSTREADLVEYYNNEVPARAHRDLPATRAAARAAYVDLLSREGRTTVLEVGCGPGRDGTALQDDGLTYTGVDLAPASVEHCRAIGLDAHVASVLDLPFPDATFDAGWTMSTLLHIDNADLRPALSEICRVLRPGAPLAIGLWGAAEATEHAFEDETEFGPARFFSIRTDDQLRAELEQHGVVEEWSTWEGEPMHYQWAVLRTR